MLRGPTETTRPAPPATPHQQQAGADTQQARARRGSRSPPHQAGRAETLPQPPPTADDQLNSRRPPTALCTLARSVRLGQLRAHATRRALAHELPHRLLTRPLICRRGARLTRGPETAPGRPNSHELDPAGRSLASARLAPPRERYATPVRARVPAVAPSPLAERSSHDAQVNAAVERYCSRTKGVTSHAAPAAASWRAKRATSPTQVSLESPAARAQEGTGTARRKPSDARSGTHRAQSWMPNGAPHRGCRCALPQKIPAHKHFSATSIPRKASFVTNPCPIETPAPPHEPNKKPSKCWVFLVGAPGFEPGTSPTRIMGENRAADERTL